MAKRVKVPITSARNRLFELAGLVREAGDDTVVVLEQRGHSEAVALVREARLAYLEERVMQMEKQDSAAFQLAGSVEAATSESALEQALHEIRLEWGAPRTAASPAPARQMKSRRRT